MYIFLTSNLFLILLSCLLLLAPIDVPHANEANLKLPPGFKISTFADERTKKGHLLSDARFMAFDNAGRLHVSSAKGDKILMLPDANGDGAADEVITVVDGLNAPQGIVFLDNQTMLVANQDGVVKFKLADGRWQGPQPFIPNLPQGWHTLKTIKLGPDGYLYINVGSSCNVCIEADANRATILRYTTDGKPAGALQTLGRHQQSAIWAKGLRNSQGFAWHPQTKEMFATNNGSDNRAGDRSGKVNDELPPEHLNKIEPGKHYGWPHCWANPDNPQTMFEDPNFKGAPGFCAETQAPAIIFRAHTTPIGISFLHNTNWPAEYKTDAIVALHGSWNRKEPAGYQLVRVKFKDNQAYAVEDFVSGWLSGYRVTGRPVDVIVGNDGALYVSDDMRGAVYRISYEAR